MAGPSICGNFIGSKRALLAFTWSITTVLTFLAFFLAIAMVIQIHSHYKFLEKQSYYSNDDVYRRLEGDENQRGEEEQHEEHQEEGGQGEVNWYPILADTSSGSMTFVSIWTMTLAILLSVYGSTAIVGFTNIQGVYIAPCFPNRSRLKIGIFGGAVVMFANLLLLNAIIFGEFRVADYRDNRDREELEPYAVERIATVLAVTCMFLSVLYAIFAILLFLSYATDNQSDKGEESDSDSRTKPLADHRQQFITIGEPA